MHHTPPTHRRLRTPVLQQLEARVDCSLTTLKESLDADPSEADHPDIISTMVSETKTSWKAYQDSSTRLTSKYVEIASYQEAQASREGRAEMRTEVHQFIDLANGLLRNLSLDVVSNIDTGSMVAGECMETSKGAISKLEGFSVQQCEEPENAVSQSNFEGNMIPKINITTLPDSMNQSTHQDSTKPKTVVLSSEPQNQGIVTTRQARFNFPVSSRKSTILQPPKSRPIFTYADINSNLQTSFAGIGNNNNQGPFPQANSHQIGSTTQPMHEATLHLVKQELFKESTFPFDGDCQRYHSWVMLLRNRMRNVQLDSLDQISILIANTSGRPKRLVEDYLAAGAAFPDETLIKIWNALQKQYGSPVRVSQSMQKKLHDFPTIRPPNVGSKMQELAHLCRLIEANMTNNSELHLYNLSLGQKQVWGKLPDWLQKKWRSIGYQYGTTHMGALPPFPTLIEFIENSGDELSDPNFEQLTETRLEKRTFTTNSNHEDGENSLTCLFHDRQGHALVNCNSFRTLNYQSKLKFAFEKKLCYKCLGEHFARDCSGVMKCFICKKDHLAIMHPERTFNEQKEIVPTNRSEPTENTTLCSVVCGSPHRAMSCSKTILCEIHHESRPNKTMNVYVILDDMSDSSYISDKVVEKMELTGKEEKYLLSTMNSFRSEHRGLLLSGLWIRGINKDEYHSLPNMLSSSFIPGSVYEVGTPSIVRSIPHLSHLSHNFIDLDRNSEPLILLGRDSCNLMKSVCHGDRSPFACETPLGYALIGSPCVNVQYKSKVKTSLRTILEHYSSKTLFPDNSNNLVGIFDEFRDDDTLGPSKEDIKFQSIVENTINVNEAGYITINLPFKRNDIAMPDNKSAVYSRTFNTLAKLRSQPEKLKQCVDAMSKNIAAGHVEPVPEEDVSRAHRGKSWFIPIFAVTQPKKDKARLVFDSSATYSGVSLNSCLLQGPDQNNRLRGVLMRFRIGEIAFGGDIEAMFYNFHLPKEDRDFLRYFWYKNNDPIQKLIQYRGCVHLFGNKCSPALAHAGLKYTTLNLEAQSKPLAVKSISKNIYVDDLLSACRVEEEAIGILEDIREILQRYKIRLCKIISNSKKVMNHFPYSELASTECEVEIGDSTVHRALGLAWQVTEDTFFIKVELQEKPFTRRGMLAVTNSIHDPLGIVGPVTLQGKIIQRKALRRDGSSENYDWDEPLPREFAEEWRTWLQSLTSISNITLARSYIPAGFGNLSQCELHTFADASEAAIGAVVYLRIFDENGNVHVSYVTSTSRLIPKSCISMPRSELCAALLGSNLYNETKNELGIRLNICYMYCDSKVVLAYLYNEEKRFAKYVSHRVQSILKITDVSQWHYVTSNLNPADIACRPQTVRSLVSSEWLEGPSFLWEGLKPGTGSHPCSDLPADLPEVLEGRVAMTTEKGSICLFTTLLERVSSFSAAISVLVTVMKFCSALCKRLGYPTSIEVLKGVVISKLINSVQKSCYGQLLKSLAQDQQQKDRRLGSLDPFVDEKGLLRVGGRLRDSFLQYEVKHPILLPSNHPLSILIIRHYHAATQHQGRHITLGAVRSAGYFIERGNQLVKNIIKDCVFCRKLRAKPVEQLMAPLPPSRVEETAPFHNTGLDVFGPFLISENKSTRQTKGTKKMWGLILTCMASRAVHVEPLQGLDTSSLANALRRFVAIRGTCKNLYSDQGTNFIGMNNQDELCLNSVKNQLDAKECTWHFNPPHASHFGGPWERKIGAIRRILEGSMAQLKGRVLSRDELCTLLLEAMAVVNGTPMWEISSSSGDPIPISPSMLLTLKDSPNPPPAESLSESDIAAYGGKRWRRVQFLADCFWDRWRLYYLAGLQERSKWTLKGRNMKEGDVVLLRNKTEKRNFWPLAIVRSVKKSADGLVRSVFIETMGRGGSRRLLERPISELILLIASTK